MNTTESEKKIIELYQSGMGIFSLQKLYPYSKEDIKSILKKNNIHIRNRHEAIIARNKTGNLLENHEYFQSETRNMAWLLGFIAADGSIEKDRNVIKISLSQVDHEILEKIRKEIQLKSEVKRYMSNDGFLKSKIQWSSEQHKKDLAYYNITPQKTFTLKPPNNLNKEFVIDYIRGFWDGDGSITMCKTQYNTLEWQIGSASKPILEFFVDYLYEEYGIPKVKVHSYLRGEHYWHLLQYSTKASIKLYDIMYNGISKDDLYIARKKEKYDKIIQEKLSLK